jgi:hypothetical protein
MELRLTALAAGTDFRPEGSRSAGTHPFASLSRNFPDELGEEGFGDQDGHQCSRGGA